MYLKVFWGVYLLLGEIGGESFDCDFLTSSLVDVAIEWVSVFRLTVLEVLATRRRLTRVRFRLSCLDARRSLWVVPTLGG